MLTNLTARFAALITAFKLIFLLQWSKLSSDQIVLEIFGASKGTSGERSERLAGVFVSENVVNLSDKNLSEDQIKLLSKGLKFSPTPRDIDKGQLKADVDAFKRRIRLSWYFKDEENSDYDPDAFYVISGWNPPRADNILETYLSLLEKEVLSVSPEGRNFSNLSFGERQALGELKSDKTIVIKEADKGSAVVVWDRQDYVAEANRQLSDSGVYEELDRDPTAEVEAEIRNCVSEIQVCDPGVSDKGASYLQVKKSKLGRFYLLPKIHKGLSNVVGRPVISNCGTATEHISEFLDHHLNPLVSNTGSYVKDTNHFLLLLAGLGDIPGDALLCTADVVGLYPSIPRDEDLEAMRCALDSRRNPGVSTSSLVNLAKVVLENNVFEFDGKVYKQKLGTAIGTKFAPAYANLFMADFETKLLDGSVDKPLVWFRYIDDVFFHLDSWSE